MCGMLSGGAEKHNFKVDGVAQQHVRVNVMYGISYLCSGYAQLKCPSGELAVKLQ